MARNSNPRNSHANNFFKEEDEEVPDTDSSISEISSMLNGATIEGNLHSILSSVTKSNWTIQTVATDHICNSLHWFTSYSSISPLQIRLGNGTMVTTHISGTVKLTESITLFNVFFVPEFDVNMISVGKLTRDLNCKVMIGGNSCVIQELNGTKILGVAKVFEGRYHLQLDSNSIVSSVTKTNWTVQTAATDHICTSLHWFTTYKSISPLQIRLGNGSMITTHISGIVKLTDSITLYDVLFVPEFNVNMISVGKLTEDLNCEVMFGGGSCVIKESNGSKVLGVAKLIESRYHLQFDLVNSVFHDDDDEQLGHNLISNNLPDCICSLWHLKLGHLSYNTMMVLNEKYDDIPVLIPSLAAACDVCNFVGEAEKRLPAFLNSSSKAEREFELMHVNIWEPYSTTSIHGFRYCLTMVDDFSRFTWIVLLKSISDVSRYIERFVHLVETHFEKKIKTICSNNGPEFLHGDFYTSKGIIHDTSCVKIPQQNDLLESILNMSKALMYQSKLPKFYWSYAVLHSVYLINRIPIELLGNKSPFEVLHWKLPDLTILHVFGCLCYTSAPQVNRGKHDPPVKKCVFLGFQKGTESYLLLDITTGDILKSQDVIFHDSEFPFDKNTAAPSTTPTSHLS